MKSAADRQLKNTRRLAEARRVVVKVGSSLLVNEQSGELDQIWLDALIDDVVMLHRRGQQPVLVSSGAIALGRRRLDLAPGRLQLKDSQAAAAVGQIHLARAYSTSLARFGLTGAQILLTIGDTERRTRYLNARDTMETLLALGAVPVINENDTVATAEIRYGDNDRLAARVAQLAGADCLVMLSDVDALYDADPRHTQDSRPIDEVTRITPELEQAAGSATTACGTGGMVTKLAAAKIATAAGCSMVIASGRVPHPITALEAGGRCTWFPARANSITVRKRWIAGHLEIRGAYSVDAGAARALADGKSLLPAGTVAIRGEFARGDAVAVIDHDGLEIARGLSAYASTDAQRLLGQRSGEIEKLLGYRGPDELIHRGDLVLTDDLGPADD
ncbi:MAG: glutamate 5-kinase [Gammaproteobacteria bacterium]|nr:glutamate 5-kinase [Gammaproteobacteria bacterium]